MRLESGKRLCGQLEWELEGKKAAERQKRPPGAGGLENSRKFFGNAPEFGGFRG